MDSVKSWAETGAGANCFEQDTHFNFRARLELFMRLFFHFRWVHFPAWSGLAFWVVLQLMGPAQQIGGFSNVSALAHLGGAVVGLIAWLGWGINSPFKKAATNASRF